MNLVRIVMVPWTARQCQCRKSCQYSLVGNLEQVQLPPDSIPGQKCRVKCELESGEHVMVIPQARLARFAKVPCSFMCPAFPLTA
jgi:hypothetical protein